LIINLVITCGFILGIKLNQHVLTGEYFDDELSILFEVLILQGNAGSDQDDLNAGLALLVVADLSNGILGFLIVLDVNSLVLFVSSCESVVEVLNAKFCKNFSDFSQVITGSEVCILNLSELLILEVNVNQFICLNVIIIIFECLRLFSLWNVIFS